VPQTIPPQIAPTTQAFEATDWPTLLMNLGFGFVFAILLRLHFQMFGSTLSNRREFSRTFPMILMTTILVISIVKHSWQLGLGLVGALSIVRFRTPIKEPEELAYLFLAIGMGIGFGADMPRETSVAGVGILAAMAVMHWTRRDRRAKGLFVSIEWQHPADREKPLDVLSRIIGAHAMDNDLRRVDRHSDRLDATFFVDLANMEQLSDLLAQLDQECPGVTVTVIDQNRLPSV
jgi:Domain of unknown function (DUF4956)